MSHNYTDDDLTSIRIIHQQYGVRFVRAWIKKNGKITAQRWKKPVSRLTSNQSIAWLNSSKNYRIGIVPMQNNLNILVLDVDNYESDQHLAEFLSKYPPIEQIPTKTEGRYHLLYNRKSAPKPYMWTFKWSLDGVSGELFGDNDRWLGIYHPGTFVQWRKAIEYVRSGNEDRGIIPYKKLGKKKPKKYVEPKEVGIVPRKKKVMYTELSDDLSDSAIAILLGEIKSFKKQIKLEQALEEDQVIEAISFIDPDCSYPDWLSIGMALHSWDHPEAFNIWEVWSKQGKKYSYGVCHRKWNTFGRSGVGMGTFYMISDTWRNYRQGKAPRPGV